MTNQEQFEQILEQAKQGRAEVIAFAAKTRGVRLAVVATLALVLAQFMIEPTSAETRSSETLQNIPSRPNTAPERSTRTLGSTSASSRLSLFRSQ